MYTYINGVGSLQKNISFCLIVGYLTLILLLVIRNYDIFDAIYDYHYKRFAKIERLPFLSLHYNTFLIHIQYKHVFKGMRKVDDIAFKISFNLKTAILTSVCHRPLQSCRLKWLTLSKRRSWLTCRSNSWAAWRSTPTSRTERSRLSLTAPACMRERDACMCIFVGVKSALIENYLLCSLFDLLLTFFQVHFTVKRWDRQSAFGKAEGGGWEGQGAWGKLGAQKHVRLCTVMHLGAVNSQEYLFTCLHLVLTSIS